MVVSSSTTAGSGMAHLERVLSTVAGAVYCPYRHIGSLKIDVVVSPPRRMGQ